MATYVKQIFTCHVGEDSLLIERILQLAILITLLRMLTEFSREIYFL